MEGVVDLFAGVKMFGRIPGYILSIVNKALSDPRRNSRVCTSLLIAEKDESRR